MVRKNSGRDWKNLIVENGSYKLVALFVTLILWVTILGRRDFVLTKDMDVEFLLPRAIAVADGGRERRVSVKVSGPRMALKKFAANPGTITIDLSVRAEPGPVQANITSRNIEVPFGVKVISVMPDTIKVNLVEAVADPARTAPTGR